MSELFHDDDSELSVDALFDAAGHWQKIRDAKSMAKILKK